MKLYKVGVLSWYKYISTSIIKFQTKRLLTVNLSVQRNVITLHEQNLILMFNSV